MKALLVVDMPKDCGDCRMIDCVNYDNTRARCKAMVYAKNEHSKYIGINDKPSWCPLKPIPQKKEVKEINDIDDFMKSEIQIINEKVTARMMLDTELLLASGYNLCVDELLGEEE